MGGRGDGEDVTGAAREGGDGGGGDVFFVLKRSMLALVKKTSKGESV